MTMTPRPSFGFSAVTKKTLEYVLEHKGRHGEQRNAGIKHTVCQQRTVGTKPACNQRGKEDAERGEDNASDQREIYQHGKVFVCLLFFAFAQCLCNDRTSSGTDHEA